MSASDILQLLRKVKAVGKNQWVACCPAHDDRSPSMTITETADGKVLIHDFAGCSVDEILGSLGLELDVLFPDQIVDSKPERMPFNARAILTALAHEAMIVALASVDIANGKKLSREDHKRLIVAVGRINKGAGMCHGN